MKRTFSWLVLIGLFAVLSWMTMAIDVSRISSAQQAPAIIKVDPKLFDEYVGQYAFATNPDVVLSFFREEEKYYVHVANRGRYQIFPESTTKFLVNVLDADVTFVRDAQNKVT